MDEIQFEQGEVSSNNNNDGDGLPQVEVKVFKNTLLLKLQCEKRRGVLSEIFTEVEKFDLSFLNSNVMAFGTTALDITIVAQIGEGRKQQMKGLVEALYSILKTPDN